MGLRTGVCVCSNPPDNLMTDNSDWSEEKAVLEAIYGDDAKFLSPSSASIQAVLPTGDIPNLLIEVSIVVNFLH